MEVSFDDGGWRGAAFYPLPDYSNVECNFDGHEPARAPRYQYDLGLEYRGARGAFARVVESHDERAPSRHPNHLEADVSGKHRRAEVRVRNLFDRYYSQRDGDGHISLTENG